MLLPPDQQEEESVHLKSFQYSPDIRSVENHPNEADQVDNTLLSRDTFKSIPQTPRQQRSAHFVFTFFYAVTLLFAWIVTTVLSFKPIGGHEWYRSYASIGPCHYQTGNGSVGFGCQSGLKTLSQGQLDANDRWRQAIRIIGSLIAVLAIPISSGICARGAVAYLQTRRDFPFSKALALADRGWWDPTIASQLVRPAGRKKLGSKYLLFSSFVCLLGALIWPLQEILLKQDGIRLVVRASDKALLTTDVVTFDADIAGLMQVNSTDTISTTVASLNSAGYWDSQPNIWRTPGSACDGSMSWTLSCVKQGKSVINYYPLRGDDSFVSNVLNSANTGLVDNHAFRFNSSVSCANVDEDEYPSKCTGFAASTVSNTTDGQLEFRVCAPADVHRFPWKLTRNRQEIEENVYLQFNADVVSFLSNGTRNTSLTQRCTSQTTSGYFLLPNQNSTKFGPLLDEFDLLTSTDPQMIFSDWSTGTPETTLGDAYPIPNNTANPALGPLLTSTISLFGPSTFFSTRANTTSPNTTIPPPETCKDPIPLNYIPNIEMTGSAPTRQTIPFIPLPNCASTSPQSYTHDLNNWLTSLFLDPTSASTTSTFTQAIYLSNKANLERAAAEKFYRRTILQDAGTEAQKLRIHPAAVGVISALVGCHLAGLVGLAFYAAMFPTWTETLDSFAVLRLGMRVGGGGRS